MGQKRSIAIGLLATVVVIIVGLWAPTSFRQAVDTNVSSQSEVSPPIQLARMKAVDIVSDDNKLNIYLFWGDGCPHCKELAQYLGTIKEEYGKYYNLYTLETWYDDENATLMKGIAKAVGEEPAGVPYLLIGDKSFTGYAPRMDADIERAITEQSQRADKFDAYKKYRKQAN